MLGVDDGGTVNTVLLAFLSVNALAPLPKYPGL